ncbi:hypothetical protein Tco_0105298 [Tanacetum coccineum]
MGANLYKKGNTWLSQLLDRRETYYYTTQLKHILDSRIHQSPRGIFINQSQYTLEILKKHSMDGYDSISTLMATARIDADLQVSLDLSRLATTLNRLERSIQTGINRWYQSHEALDLGSQGVFIVVF